MGGPQQTIGDVIEMFFSDTRKTGLASKVAAIPLI
jgi:hypothetical protein